MYIVVAEQRAKQEQNGSSFEIEQSASGRFVLNQTIQDAFHDLGIPVIMFDTTSF